MKNKNLDQIEEKDYITPILALLISVGAGSLILVNILRYYGIINF